MGLRFGFALFDEPKTPESGWHTVAGGRARRFRSITELATDTLWWTNVPYEAFFFHTEIWKNPNLRHDKYLVTSPGDVLKEWGYDKEVYTPDVMCDFLAQAFQRVCAMAWDLIRKTVPKVRIEDAFSRRQLREDLRCVLPPLDYPLDEAAAVFKSGHGYQEMTSTNSRSPKGGRWVKLYHPRMDYALDILNAPVPEGEFEHRGRSAMRGLKSKLDYVLGSDRPIIAESALENMDELPGGIYAFGAAMDRDKRKSRSWIAAKEIHTLSRFSDIDVRSVYVGERYQNLVHEVSDPVQDLLSLKIAHHSWTAGVIAETIWRAVNLGEDREARNVRPGDERAQSSWQGIWVRAEDKVRMFPPALRLSELGHSVLSYGFGWIRCCVLPEDVETYIRDGLELGLVPEMTDIPPDVFDDITPASWGGKRETAQLAMMIMKRQRSMLWKLDRIPLLEKSKRNEAIMALMGKKTAGRAKATA